MLLLLVPQLISDDVQEDVCMIDVVRLRRGLDRPFAGRCISYGYDRPAVALPWRRPVLRTLSAENGHVVERCVIHAVNRHGRSLLRLEKNVPDDHAPPVLSADARETRRLSVIAEFDQHRRRHPRRLEMNDDFSVVRGIGESPGGVSPESHPRALAELYVNVSAHTAPIIQPPVSPPADANGRTGAFPISRSRAHTHRRHGHPLQTVPSAGLIERPQEKNRVDALR